MPDTPINQCDGCQARWPLRDGIHVNPNTNTIGWDSFKCTADRYMLLPAYSPVVPENVAQYIVYVRKYIGEHSDEPPQLLGMFLAFAYLADELAKAQDTIANLLEKRTRES